MTIRSKGHDMIITIDNFKMLVMKNSGMEEGKSELGYKEAISFPNFSNTVN